MRADYKIKLSGHFTLVVHSEARGSRVVADFDNIILNQGLDRLAVGTSANYCQVGTGSTTPAVTQTSLASYLANSNDTSTVAEILSYVPGSTPYTQVIRTYRFGTGVAAGTISEVGTAWSGTGSNLFSRALILDSLGSPTSITVLSDETLDVKYTFRIYSPTADVTGTIVIGGDTYNYILRAAEIDDATSFWNASAFLNNPMMQLSFSSNARIYPATSVLGATTVLPSGTATNSDGAPASSTYVPGNYWREAEATWGLTANPAGGVACADFAISYTTSGIMKMSFSPVIPKDNTKTLKLKVRTTWARV